MIHHPNLEGSRLENIGVFSTLKVEYEPREDKNHSFLCEGNWPSDVRRRTTLLFSKSPIKIEWEEKNKFTSKSIKTKIVARKKMGDYVLYVCYDRAELSITHPEPVKSEVP
jgi:hypothetical protein